MAAKTAFWAASLVSGVVYNGILFVSTCASAAVDTTLGITSTFAAVIGGPIAQHTITITRFFVKPTIERSAQVFAIGTSLAAGLATGMLVFTVERYRISRGDLIEDFPALSILRDPLEKFDEPLLLEDDAHRESNTSKSF